MTSERENVVSLVEILPEDPHEVFVEISDHFPLFHLSPHIISKDEMAKIDLEQVNFLVLDRKFEMVRVKVNHLR